MRCTFWKGTSWSDTPDREPLNLGPLMEPIAVVAASEASARGKAIAGGVDEGAADAVSGDSEGHVERQQLLAVRC